MMFCQRPLRRFDTVSLIAKSRKQRDANIVTINALLLYEDPGATLDDLNAAATTLEETASTMRRLFGVAHPTTVNIERALQNARAALRARETPSPGSA